MLLFSITKLQSVAARLFVTLLLSLALPVLGHELRLFDFNENYPTGCEDPERPCFTLKDLIQRGLEHGMDSREQIQLLFQARAASRIKLGLLLPQFDPVNSASAAMEGKVGIDTALLFVGFLSPSRWFDYKSAKDLRKAQEEAVATVFANTAQAIQTLYFNIQMQIWSIRILQFYIYEIDNLIEFLEHCENSDTKSTLEDIAVLQNIKAKFEYDLAFIDALSSDLPNLATLVGLSPDVDWQFLKVEEHVLSPIPQQYAHYGDFYPEAKARSTELRNVHHLMAAAHQQKRSAYFEFIDPLYAATFGFGYGYSIKIARSNIEILNIAKQRTAMQLSNTIQYALNNYNDSISALPAMERALERLVDIRPSVESHINNANAPLDINRLARYFEYSAGQALRYISSYFIFRSAEADLKRYTWSGEMYELVDYYRTHKMAEFLEAAKKQHSFRHLIKTRWRGRHKKDQTCSQAEEDPTLVRVLHEL
jgi:hypothetical protein